MTDRDLLKLVDLIRHAPSDAVALTWLKHAQHIALNPPCRACGTNGRHYCPADICGPDEDDE